MNYLCIFVQRESFNKQYRSLQIKDFLPYKDQLLNFNPIMFNNSLMRDDGRLSNTDYAYGINVSIILDANHHVPNLIGKQSHKLLMHTGPQFMLASLRQILDHWQS